MSSEQGESTQNRRICAYFQTPRGCVKGNACDFLHPLPDHLPHLSNMSVHGNMQNMQNMQNMPNNMPNNMQSGLQPGNDQSNKKVCDFFLTPRGCAKGNQCDFAHVNPHTSTDPYSMYSMGGMGGMGAMGGYHNVMTGRGMFPGMVNPMMGGGRGGGTPQFGIGRGGVLVPKRPKACEFFNTERGCIKGERCDFIHTKDKVCDFYFTDRGCRKGKFCDFKHPEKDDDESTGEDGRPKKVFKTDKVCAFYLGDRGCRKGKLCDFQHPDGGTTTEDEREKDTKKESTRYKPY